MSDEEIDFEFELDQETLKQLENEERQYYSQIQPETQYDTIPQTQRTVNYSTQEPRAHIVDRETSLSTQPDTAKTTTSEKDKHLLRDLQYKLQISENHNKRLKDQVKDSQDKVIKAKLQAARNSKSSTQQDQSKRHFPGLPVPQTKTKSRRVLPISSSRESSSVSISQATSSTQADTSRSSINPILPQSQSTNQLEPEIERHVAPTLLPAQIQLESKAKRYHSATIYNQTESEDNLQLLRILFADIFKAWNRTQTNPRDFNMSLTSSRIKEFSKTFSKGFVPSQANCTATGASRLKVLASEINYIISQSSNADATIRSLFSQFGFCLSIYIEEKLLEKIQMLSEIIQKLVSAFYPAKDLFYKELIVDKSNSILYKLTKALSLFPFAKIPEGARIVEEYPHLKSSNYMEIMEVAEKFNTYPSVINEALRYEKTPEGAIPTVTFILGIFICIGRYSLESIFRFLVAEKGFLQLLSKDTPFQILNHAFNVLETTLLDDKWMDMSSVLETKDGAPCEFIVRITDLLSIPQGNINERDWYKLRDKLLSLFDRICMVQLKPSTLSCIQKWTYCKTVELMLACTYFEPRKEKITKNKEQERLVTKGFETIAIIVSLNPPDLFKFNIENTEIQLATLVRHFIERANYEDPIITKLYDTMENYISRLQSEEPMEA